MWKDIKGYEGLYQVSTNGEVRSLDHYRNGRNGHKQIVRGRTLKINTSYGSYGSVMLSKDGQTRRFYVHRLVAETFIENPHNYPVVNHINGDKYDNSVSNLEWCTCQYNSYHAVHIIKTLDMSKVTNKQPVKILNTITGEILEFESHKECEKYFKDEFRRIVGNRQAKKFSHLRLVGDVNGESDKLEN